MDGDQMTDMQAEALRPDQTRRALDIDRTTRRPKTVRWFLIIALLLAMVLGGLYGFNRFREQAIATYFATNKPPPAQISAVEVRTEAVPRFAPAIGSLAAVHQVTINPEIGGRVVKIFFEPGMTVKAGEPLVQLNDAPEQADLRNYEAQARWAAATLQRSTELAKSQLRGAGNRRPKAEPARPSPRADHEDRGADRAKADPRAVRRQARRAADRTRAIPEPRRADRDPDRSVDALREFHPAGDGSARRSRSASGSTSRRTPSPAASFRAEITTIEPQISADTRTMQVQATMKNPDDALLPGMFVDAAVVLPPQPDMLVLPATAVEYTLYGDSVFVIREDGKDAKGEPILKAVRTPVKTGTRWGDNVAILDGLKPGERVVCRGPGQGSERRPGQDRQPRSGPALDPDAELSRMSFTDIFIRRPVLALVVSLLILLIGLRAMLGLPIRQYPKLSNTTITVTTIYPGASPDLMQGFIATPIAQAVATAEGIDYLTSNSVQGTSTITAYIRLNFDPTRR